MVQKGAVNLQYISIDERIVDIRTNLLSRKTFVFFRYKLCVMKNVSLIERECLFFSSYQHREDILPDWSCWFDQGKWLAHSQSFSSGEWPRRSLSIDDEWIDSRCSHIVFSKMEWSILIRRACEETIISTDIIYK